MAYADRRCKLPQVDGEQAEFWRAPCARKQQENKFAKITAKHTILSYVMHESP